jgi:hypothetical protein
MQVKLLMMRDMYAGGLVRAMHGRGNDEAGWESVDEGGTIGVCGATGGTTIEGASSRNS